MPSGGGGGAIAPDPLVKRECIYFCTNVHIWIDLRDKYGTKEVRALRGKFGPLFSQKLKATFHKNHLIGLLEE